MSAVLISALLAVGCGVLALLLALVIWQAVWTSFQPPAATTPTAPTVATNPYDAADFEYDGLFLACTAGKSLPGIDVSSHQGKVDWQKVADAGVKFVFVRLGYRGYRNGAIHEDIYAKTNLAQARAAGLQVGAYFFSQAISEEEAAEEAAFALKVLDGFQLDLPLVYDWEYVAESARTGEVTKNELMVYTKVFCDAVEAAGYSREEITETKLLSPAQMDKALGKKKAAELLEQLIDRAPGAPTLAPATDKRPAYDRLAEAQNDFN
jgi:GH25 family lysozyme M1 (1,4-beta-N-acetylmuramidase)